MIYHIYDKTKLSTVPDDDMSNRWVDFRDFYNLTDITNDDILVKELINSDDFLRMILSTVNYKKSFLSHCFYFEKPQNINNEKIGVSSFVITDAALNQFPILSDRIKITKNAIDFCIKNKLFNDERLLVTFLNHSGHFNIKNPTACDSHLLFTECERTMSDIADFSDYQLDCCLSPDARSIKGIKQTRNTNIIVVNDINEGNSIVKSFLLNGWHGYGFLTGLDMRIVLNSRANLHDNPGALNKIQK